MNCPQLGRDGSGLIPCPPPRGPSSLFSWQSPWGAGRTAYPGARRSGASSTLWAFTVQASVVKLSGSDVLPPILRQNFSPVLLGRQELLFWQPVPAQLTAWSMFDPWVLVHLDCISGPDSHYLTMGPGPPGSHLHLRDSLASPADRGSVP